MANKNNVNEKGVTALYNKMMTDVEFRNRMIKKLSLEVVEGDWDSIVEIAKKEGFEFTTQELKDIIPEGFYKGHGQYPEEGWKKN